MRLRGGPCLRTDNQKRKPSEREESHDIFPYFHTAFPFFSEKEKTLSKRQLLGKAPRARLSWLGRPSRAHHSRANVSFHPRFFSCGVGIFSASYSYEGAPFDCWIGKRRRNSIDNGNVGSLVRYFNGTRTELMGDREVCILRRFVGERRRLCS